MRLLIVKTSALGDIIQSFPALHLLRDRFPDAEIDWVVENESHRLVAAHPMVTRAVPIDTRSWRKRAWSPQAWRTLREQLAPIRELHYDWIFDLQANMKSSLVLGHVNGTHKVGYSWKDCSEGLNWFFVSQHIGIPEDTPVRKEYLTVVRGGLKDDAPFEDPGVRLRVNAEEEAAVQQALAGREAAILVCPGSRWANKQLLPETLAELLCRIRDTHDARFLLLWGNKPEHVLADQLREAVGDAHAEILPKLTLPALQHVMGGVSQVLSMDSLPLHLAGTTKTPTFGFFGASSGRKYAPTDAYWQGTCPYGEPVDRRCRKLRRCDTGACIRAASIEELWQAYEAWRRDYSMQGSSV